MTNHFIIYIHSSCVRIFIINLYDYFICFLLFFILDRFPEAVVTNCRKCTRRQSENFDKLTDWYTKHEPEKYNAIVGMALKKLMKKS
uniref:Chemosensory protein 7 n=1 Tax=Meteorus pulchricornis TaxID=51522 RepID=A0A1S5VFI6_9HYME|nr:chemosensory protein 7 [Meteorus pulchricornis]